MTFPRALGAGLVALVAVVVVGAATTPAPVETVSSPTSIAVTRLGFLTNGGLAGYTTLNRFLGRRTTFVVQNADYRSVNAFESSVWGEVADVGQFQTLSKQLTFVLSVPLTIGLDFHASKAQRAVALTATASGVHDPAIRYISQLLRQGGYPDAIIRLGWEFDGGWMPWSAVGNEALWVKAYRHVHDVMRSVSPDFTFDWNGDPGYMQRETAAYPGDKYVDIIGNDVYDQPVGVPWNPSTGTWFDPKAAWSSILVKLRWQRDFAVAHGKQVSYPEWALSGVTSQVAANVGGDNPTFIQGMYDWMNSLPASGPGSLAYSSYFNADAEAKHRIDGREFPHASARFTALFGSAER